MTTEEEVYVQSEADRALSSICPKCGAVPGVWCTAWATMHYERWGYGPLGGAPADPR